ncbi:hypothetical protein DL95DRAFT_412225 [Leptodontidium sp. 2 PMI_412]|nr:hypothetical protein DL95DRAFT_412225 [Leptodontidium sp. 2 PMI_412]
MQNNVSEKSRHRKQLAGRGNLLPSQVGGQWTHESELAGVEELVDAATALEKVEPQAAAMMTTQGTDIRTSAATNGIACAQTNRIEGQPWTSGACKFPGRTRPASASSLTPCELRELIERLQLVMRRIEALEVRWENGVGKEIRWRERKRRGGSSSTTCYSQQRLGSNNCKVNDMNQ